MICGIQIYCWTRTNKAISLDHFRNDFLRTITPLTYNDFQIEQRCSIKTGVKQMTSKTQPTVTLAQLARDLNINPKVARAKARRHAADLPKTVGDDNWIFPASAKSKLIE